MKLIEFVDNNLNLSSKLDIKNKYIISIVGDARKGKSTFLNLIINYLTKENKEYFKIDDGLSHCTLGVDYYEIDDYLFLDCQGLNYQDSSNDPKLLLFIYSISNIIIYNDKNVINNNVFTTLQPMAMFLNTFKNFNASILYFRISDYELEGNPYKLLDNILINQKDQFDNVRESIKKLFSSIEINITEPLDRSEKSLFKKRDFNKILEITNFNNIIKEIYSLINSQTKKKIDINKLINNINQNKKIDYKKLDLYTQITINEVNEFIKLNISNNDDFNLFTVNGYSKNELEIYQSNINKLLNNFKEQFNKIPKNLQSLFNQELNIIKDKYQSMKDKNYKLSLEIIEPIFQKHLQINLSNIDKLLLSSNIPLYHIELNHFISKIIQLDDNSIIEMKLKLFTQINQHYQNIKEQHANYLQIYQQFIHSIDNIDINLIDIINQFDFTYKDEYSFFVSQHNLYLNFPIPYINLPYWDYLMKDYIVKKSKEYYESNINNKTIEKHYNKKIDEILMKNNIYKDIPINNINFKFIEFDLHIDYIEKFYIYLPKMYQLMDTYNIKYKYLLNNNLYTTKINNIIIIKKNLITSHIIGQFVNQLYQNDLFIINV